MRSVLSTKEPTKRRQLKCKVKRFHLFIGAWLVPLVEQSAHIQSCTESEGVRVCIGWDKLFTRPLQFSRRKACMCAVDVKAR